MSVIKSTQLAEHPLENVFDLPTASTPRDVIEYVPDERVTDVVYDEKDLEIERQFDEIYDLALSSVTQLTDSIDQIEGKYKARASEIVATNLQVALNAAKEKAAMKQHKDKKVQRAGPETVNVTNNNLYANHSDVVRLLKSAGK